jgi:hypothetical protein
LCDVATEIANVVHPLSEDLLLLLIGLTTDRGDGGVENSLPRGYLPYFTVRARANHLVELRQAELGELTESISGCCKSAPLPDLSTQEPRHSLE